jgi:ABC-2 type transport system ATP-binding protein
MSEEAAIEAEGLVKHYGKTKALDGLDLTVARGTVYGLLGPNGAGKTTAVRILATLLRPDGGQARVFGHDVATQAGAVRRVIGLTGQYAALDEYLTGRSNLVMIGELSRLTGRAARRRADELLEQFDLTDAAGRAVKTYSGGMRRRLDLAASLIGHPAVLFLDEPTTGLDPSARALMWVIVRQLVADGTTLLLTTQYLDEADQLADRIAVIDGGRAIAEGTPAELKASMGGQRLLITLAEGSDASAAVEVLGAFANGPISRARYDGEFGHRARSRGVRGVVPPEDNSDRLIEAPVTATDGLATEVVRALDAAGVKVNDIAVRSASLDDVFLTLTGHAAEEAAGVSEKADKDKTGVNA